MKKILSLILAGLMTVSCAAFVAADDAAVEATTDPVQDYAIEFLSNCGVFKGGEGLTNEDLIQRYQMALFVSRISTGWVEDSVWEDGTANDATFKDIDTEPANKYLGALSYANQNGIIEGYTANTFAPYASITYRDALTMVVRTLGYKGLSYPWGNIEKAVELGLTEGVDAAYTDELTRGEVAVIIYNAMFAKNSKGETLAKSIFGYDFGFQNIVIVSTDEYGYAANGDRAAAGYVGFKTIDENGVLGSKVYYVKASEFGFEGHAEELAVGEVFVALFEIDGDYTNMIDVASMKTATVMNNGITDNDGKAYETMPIAAALADYTLVKDYTKGILNYTYEDLRVYAYGFVDAWDMEGGKKLIGIDASNNIVKFVDGEWTIEWFYNDTLQEYYRYIMDKDNAASDKTDVAAGSTDVYVDWMTEKDFNEWYAGAIKVLKASYYELKLQETPAATITNGKAPYAKLNLFNIDEDALAEIATYKSYSIGLFSNTMVKCGKNADSINHTDVKMPAYKLTDLDKTTSVEIFVEAGHEKHEDDHGYAFGWLNVDPSVTTFDTTKTYTDAVVLYSYNKTTGEIEIVKHITDGANDDADSKIITGVLQAYSTKNETVTIDGTVYPIDYDNLSGDTFVLDGSLALREVVARDLDEQYMQYVTAIICDGYVVDVDLRGEDADSIVVLGYAGITSDGYIAVYGYKTDDLKLEVIKINSYNGWKKGDYRYYPANAEEDHAFDYGALYTIKSYDAESNSYGVYTENVETVLASATPVRITFKNGYRVVTPMDIVRDGDDFIWTAKSGADVKVVPTTANDKYVIVDDNGNDLTSNIYVYSGAISRDMEWAYSIDALMVGALDGTTLVLYAAYNAHFDFDLYFDVDLDGEEDNFLDGWAFRANAYEVGYVLYEGAKGKVLEAAYDEAIGGTYLLGSTLSEVRTMNLLTGDRDYVFASSNIDLVAGHVYKTIGGQIIKDVTDECDYGEFGYHGFFDAISAAYGSRDLAYADYIVANDAVLTKDTLTDLVLAYELDLHTDYASYGYDHVKWLNEVYGEYDYAGILADIEDIIEDADVTDKAIADKLIDATKIYMVTDEWAWNWNYGHDNMALEVTPIAAADLDADTIYVADLVYDVANDDVVIYIFTDEDGLAGDGQNVIKDNTVTKVFEGKFYDGGSGVKSYVAKTITGATADPSANFKWSIQDGKVTRYFDLEVSYKIEATYSDELCKHVASVELLELGVEIVEWALADNTKAWASTNAYARKALEDCNSAIHDVMAQAGIGFGNYNVLDEELIAQYAANIVNIENIMSGKVVSLEEEDITVAYKDECGLVYGVSFDLEGCVDGENIVMKNVVDTADTVVLNIGESGAESAVVKVLFYFDYLEMTDVEIDTDNLIGVDEAKVNVSTNFDAVAPITQQKVEEVKAPTSIFG